ncbi:hypothetical protein [Aureivirga marina]|nr:hypothetical protein [Aureivirga marina]
MKDENEKANLEIDNPNADYDQCSDLVSEIDKEIKKEKTDDE